MGIEFDDITVFHWEVELVQDSLGVVVVVDLSTT